MKIDKIDDNSVSKITIKISNFNLSLFKLCFL